MRHVLFFCILVAGLVRGQSVTFLEQAGLLDNSGLTSSPCRSGTAIGVADLNGDGRDDIVRLHLSKQLSIETQGAPGEPFGHLVVGELSVEKAWSVCVADVDANGFNDIASSAVDSSGSDEGVELFTANVTGTGFSSSILPDPDLVGQGMVMADLDHDGWIDVFACDDLDDLHQYRNQGDGTFLVPDPVIVDTALSPGSWNEGNYALIQTDFDGDGDTDYYLSKCRIGQSIASSPQRINRLFENDGTGSYTEITGDAGLNSGAQSWCAAFGDIDNDGDLDCFLVNHGSSSSADSALYANNGSGVFTDATTAAGLDGAVTWFGIQACFADFDNDGHLDLLVSSMARNSAERTYGFFHNDGDGTFTREANVLLHSNLFPVSYIHSFAIGDLNCDGALDLYAGRANYINTHTTEKDLLLFNQGNGNHFLSVRLVGQPAVPGGSNPNGIGSWLEAHGPWGTQVREVRSGEGYGIMNSLRAHFGLGAEEEVERLVVRWPSGTGVEIPDQPADQFLTVFEDFPTGALGFADWIAGYYPGGGDDAQADSDPDHDGLDSLIEQIQGSRPDVPDPWGGFEMERVADAGGDFLSFGLDLVPVPGVTARLEFSVNGEDWEARAPIVVLGQDPLRTVSKLRIPVDFVAEPTLLVRLRAEIGVPEGP